MKVVIIGYGSIGKRHAGIISSMNAISKVTVLSSQLNIPYETITSLDQIPKLKPDYIVIASNTVLHHEQLAYLEQNLQGSKILVEKPLFDSFYDFKIKRNKVFVGYNMRFYPLMSLIREKIFKKNLWIIKVFCGSYLPEWRPGRDYRDVYSSKIEEGGGVLLDLSHELDYVQWLTGKISLEYVRSEKVSDLEIDTDDLLLLAGKAKNCATVHICLNYFTRRPTRQILIDGEGISLQADLIANKLLLCENDETSEFTWTDHERNQSYLAQHQAIINDDLSIVCTFKEGLDTMRLINSIRSFNT